MDNFLDLKEIQKVDFHVKVDSDGLFYLSTRVTGAPVSTNMGESRSPKLEQTPGTFEQGGSLVNDLWI